jgi:hypothetical protein
MHIPLLTVDTNKFNIKPNEIINSVLGWVGLRRKDRNFIIKITLHMLVNQYNQKYDSQKMILRHIQSWLYIYFSIKESF